MDVSFCYDQACVMRKEKCSNKKTPQKTDQLLLVRPTLCGQYDGLHLNKHNPFLVQEFTTLWKGIVMQLQRTNLSNETQRILTQALTKALTFINPTKCNFAFISFTKNISTSLISQVQWVKVEDVFSFWKSCYAPMILNVTVKKWFLLCIYLMFVSLWTFIICSLYKWNI